MLDAGVVVDRDGVPFRDVEPSLLAAQDAGLTLLVAAPRGAPRLAIERVSVRIDLVTDDAHAGLREALRAAGLRPEATLHVAAAPEDVRDASAAGMPTAWVNRAGTATRDGAAAPADLEWRDLLGLVALCGATPPLVRSQPRC